MTTTPDTIPPAELRRQARLEHDRARASTLFNNAVVLSTIFEHSDSATRSRLLRVSTSAFDILKAQMYKSVRLADYERMRETWPPAERINAYTNAVRDLDISGQLPALATRFLDVWRIFGVFPHLKRVEWSHGRVDRKRGLTDKFDYHRVVELTMSKFNTVNTPTPISPTALSYRLPSSAAFDDPRIDAYSQDLRCHLVPPEWGIWTDRKGNQHSVKYYGSSDKGVFGQSFSRIDAWAYQSLLRYLRSASSSTCSHMSLVSSGAYRDSECIALAGTLFPHMRNLDLVAAGWGVWRMTALRDVDWSKCVSLRHLTITAGTINEWRSVKSSSRPECDTNAIMSTRILARDIEGVPALETLSLTLVLHSTAREAMFNAIQSMEDTCNLMLGIGGHQCRYEFHVGSSLPDFVLSHSDMHTVQQTFRHTLERLTRTEPVGWSRVTQSKPAL